MLPERLFSRLISRALPGLSPVHDVQPDEIIDLSNECTVLYLLGISFSSKLYVKNNFLLIFFFKRNIYFNYFK